MKDITITPSPFSKGELKGVLSRRLRVSWWRPSADRTSVARLCGSVPKRGRPSSRSATRQSRIANRASTRPLNLFPSPFQGEMQRGSTDAVPRAGRPHVEPTDVYSCPSQEGGYSARGARKGESKEGGAFRRPSPADRSPSPFQGEMQRGFARDVQPPTKHAAWRRVPRLVKVASGLTHRSAQRLTPLRGRPLPATAEAMEREGAKAHVQGPELRRGPVPTGPMTRPPRSSPFIPSPARRERARVRAKTTLRP